MWRNHLYQLRDLSSLRLHAAHDRDTTGCLWHHYLCHQCAGLRHLDSHPAGHGVYVKRPSASVFSDETSNIIVFGRPLSADEQRRIEERLRLYDDTRTQLLNEGADPREAAAEAFFRARWTKIH
jgi:hypothetical protein